MPETIAMFYISDLIMIIVDIHPWIDYVIFTKVELRFVVAVVRGRVKINYNLTNYVYMDTSCLSIDLSWVEQM